IAWLGLRGSAPAPPSAPVHLTPATTASAAASSGTSARPVPREERRPGPPEKAASPPPEASARPGEAPTVAASSAAVLDPPPPAASRAAEATKPDRPIPGRWAGYLTDESCKVRGAVNDHWECVQVCMRKGFRPMLEVGGTLYYLSGVERVRGERNRRVVVEGTLDTVTRTITVSRAPASRDPS